MNSVIIRVFISIMLMSTIILSGCALSHATGRDIMLEDGTRLHIGSYNAAASEPVMDPDKNVMYPPSFVNSSDSISYKIILKEQKDEILQKVDISGDNRCYEAFIQEGNTTYYYLLKPFREESGNYDMSGDEKYWLYICTQVDDVEYFIDVWQIYDIGSSVFACSIEPWVDQ